MLPSSHDRAFHARPSSRGRAGAAALSLEIGTTRDQLCSRPRMACSYEADDQLQHVRSLPRTVHREEPDRVDRTLPPRWKRPSKRSRSKQHPKTLRDIGLLGLSSHPNIRTCERACGVPLPRCSRYRTSTAVITSQVVQGPIRQHLTFLLPREDDTSTVGYSYSSGVVTT